VHTVESSDDRLKQALSDLAGNPSAEQHRRVAAEYRRLGVLDVAQDHYKAAVKLDPGDAASLDAIARIWRDWGMPQLGFSSAYRAVRLKPSSAIAANTVGTLLEAAKQVRSARQWYAHAIALDPDAAYARNNFCYALILLEEPDAVDACRRAVAAAPESVAARNNLALAYAAGGDLTRAHEQFERGNPMTADYNMGILHMAMRDYRAAATQFGVALQINPRSTLTAQRAQQARAAAEAAEGTR
jgi:tetratricopeptide (TPR) repeat protein